MRVVVFIAASLAAGSCAARGRIERRLDVLLGWFRSTPSDLHDFALFVADRIDGLDPIPAYLEQARRLAPGEHIDWESLSRMIGVRLVRLYDGRPHVNKGNMRAFYAELAVSIQREGSVRPGAPPDIEDRVWNAFVWAYKAHLEELELLPIDDPRLERFGGVTHR